MSLTGFLELRSRRTQIWPDGIDRQPPHRTVLPPKRVTSQVRNGQWATTALLGPWATTAKLWHETRP